MIYSKKTQVYYAGRMTIGKIRQAKMNLMESNELGKPYLNNDSINHFNNELGLNYISYLSMRRKNLCCRKSKRQQ